MIAKATEPRPSRLQMMKRLRDIVRRYPADEQAAELLAKYHRQPLLQFQPRPDRPELRDEQEAFVNDHDSVFSCCLGGNGSGKTIAAAVKTAHYVASTKPPRDECPFWIVGEKLDQVCNTAWKEKLSTLIPYNSIRNVSWHNARRRWPAAVNLRHPDDPERIGWVLVFKSYEQGISAMKAESIGGYWCNEEIPFYLLMEIQARCRDYNSPGWADFTPVECKDPEWPDVYERVTTKHPSAPKRWSFYHLNTACNGTVAEWWEGFRSNIPSDMLELRQYGSFTKLYGAVYKEWRPSIHVVEPFRIPHDWHRVRGIDFGFNNAYCVLWGARDRDGRWHIYDEHYATQRLIDHHVEEIRKRKWEENNPNYGNTYTDHDAQERAELENRGIHCTLANKSINQGIEYLRSLMMVRGDGKPMLTVSSKCVNLIRELPRYRWADGTDKRNPADAPLDVDNHALDSLRYMLFSEKSSGVKLGISTTNAVGGKSRMATMFNRRR